MPAKNNPAIYVKALYKIFDFFENENTLVIIEPASGIYTIRPNVAANDIQNPASITAPGEIKRIKAQATESEVKGSDLRENSIERYTVMSIITERVAETEKPVIAR